MKTGACFFFTTDVKKLLCRDATLRSMSFFKRLAESVLVFLLSFGWFALFQQWGAFADPDGFTHAKMSALIMERGFLYDFPWLDLTILHTHFVDQHLGLHLLEIPFIRFFGMLSGAQLASGVFAAVAVVVFYQCARALGAKKPWLWTILLITSTPFLVRMVLAKSSPLAVSCFLIGITAWVRTKKAPAFLAGLCFSLVHGGWLLLLLVQGILTGAIVVWNLLRRVVGRRYDVTHLPTLLWKQPALTALATSIGCALGVLVHPNSKNILTFLWVQVGVIGIQTPYYRVGLGQEWQSVNAGELLSSIPLFIVVFAAAFLAWCFRPEKPYFSTERKAIRLQRFVLLLGVIVLAALTLKSRRYGEYFIPYLALTAAAFEAELNLSVRAIKEFLQALSLRRRIVVVVIAIALLTLTVVNVVSLQRAIQDPKSLTFTYVDSPMKALAAVARPGDRIFHPQWDLFPLLFAADDRYHYISGMDPTYLFSASTTRSDIYTEFVFDRASTTNLYAFIREDLQADYILFQRARNKNLEARMTEEPRFQRLYEDATFQVYRIVE